MLDLRQGYIQVWMPSTLTAMKMLRVTRYGPFRLGSSVSAQCLLIHTLFPGWKGVWMRQWSLENSLQWRRPWPPASSVDSVWTTVVDSLLISVASSNPTRGRMGGGLPKRIPNEVKLLHKGVHWVLKRAKGRRPTHPSPDSKVNSVKASFRVWFILSLPALNFVDDGYNATSSWSSEWQKHTQ